jgi:cob(I)alamin adenosyltransferase
MQKGYIQVYTGDGKGKTTAALGLALRAAGADLKVFIAQFVKRMEYSEIRSFAAVGERVTIRQYGNGCRLQHDRQDDDAEQLARAGLAEVREVVASGAYHLVILDEANVATTYQLLDVEDLLEVIDSKPEHVELVITGRNADPQLLARADLVTEMREVRHYYQQGVTSRPGIEY